MPYYLLTLQKPFLTGKRKSNWNPPSIFPAKNGSTFDDQWWYASRSRNKILQVKESLIKNNPNPFPKMIFRIRKVEKLPKKYY